MTEEWRGIPGTDDRYEASTLGRIRSRGWYVTCASRWGGIRTYWKSGTVLKSWPDGNGYPTVYLCGDGRREAVNAHRLVALAFHGDHSELSVNHINGDKTDNRPRNLEWCTRSENNRHAVASGLMPFAKPVVRIDADGTETSFPSIQEAARVLGKGHRNIQSALKGKIQTAYGFRWKLAA